MGLLDLVLLMVVSLFGEFFVRLGWLLVDDDVDDGLGLSLVFFLLLFGELLLLLLLDL